MGLGKKSVDAADQSAAKNTAAAAVATNTKAVNEEVIDPDKEKELLGQQDTETKTKPAPAPALRPAAGAVVSHQAQVMSGMAMESYKDFIPALDFGTLPRFKTSPAGIKGDEGSIGTTCDITLVSFNDTFAISPCEDKSPKELCKFSLDGVNLSDGSGTVADHLAELKSEGWKKAAIKKNMDFIAILDDAEKECDEIGNMVMFSCSPSSVKSFERYRLNVTLRMMKDPNLKEEDFIKLTITNKPKSYSQKDFTMFEFSARK